jgi:hypothetical protein
MEQLVDIVGWLERESTKKRVKAVIHSELARVEDEWLYIPVRIEGTMGAFERAERLQELEDGWDEEHPEASTKLLLMPAAEGASQETAVASQGYTKRQGRRRHPRKYPLHSRGITAREGVRSPIPGPAHQGAAKDCAQTPEEFLPSSKRHSFCQRIISNSRVRGAKSRLSKTGQKT